LKIVDDVRKGICSHYCSCISLRSLKSW